MTGVALTEALDLGSHRGPCVAFRVQDVVMANVFQPLEDDRVSGLFGCRGVCLAQFDRNVVVLLPVDDDLRHTDGKQRRRRRGRVALETVVRTLAEECFNRSGAQAAGIGGGKCSNQRSTMSSSK